MRHRDLLDSAPVFNVQDLLGTLDYYCDALGFERPRLWGDPPYFCMPARDGLIVMLHKVEDKSRVQTARDLGKPWDAYFWVRDADALFEEFRSKGALIEYEPVTQEGYGNREFAIRDLEGHVLAFGQEMDAS